MSSHDPIDLPPSAKPLLTTQILRVFLLGHKILKSTSVDCNKINVVTVMVRIMMWESPGDSHAIAIQWVHMVKDPPATILPVHTVTSKYTFCYQ